MSRKTPGKLRGSLAFKLGLAFAMLLLVTVGSMGAYSYRQDRDNAIQRELAELRSHARELATRIDRFLTTDKGLVGHLAHTRDVQGFLAGPHRGAALARFQDWLELQAGEARSLSAIFILDPEGVCLASSNRQFIGNNFSFRPYFQQAINGHATTSDWMIGTVTRSPRIFSSAPVYVDRRIQGVLVTEFPVDEVEQAVIATGVGGRMATVLNTQGISLASSQPNVQYHAVLPLTAATLAQLDRTRQFLGQPITVTPLSQGYVDGFHQALDTGEVQTVSYQRARAPRWAAFAPLAERPWAVAVSIPEAAILLPAHQAMVRALLMGLAAALLGALVAFGLGRWLLEPIQRLAEAMARFGAGEIQARAPVRTQDERGRLGLAFNAMAEALQAHRERLEELVKARTRELSLSNTQFQESNQRLELATTSGRLGIWDRDLADGHEFWNGWMFEMYGLAPRDTPPDYAEWAGTILHPEDRPDTEARIEAAIRGERPYDLAFRVLRPDGSVRHIKSDGQLVRSDQGRPVRIIGINRDRTAEVEAEAERRRLQTELQHAEKMESIGSLAGGVAHDLNNVLAAILGMASVLRTRCAGDDPAIRPLDIITSACTRGREVVKSLLYFARKDLEATGPVDLNLMVREMVQLLSYTTLSRIDTRLELQESLGLIEGDAGALGHALINLCVNAVDAMPRGGTLTLRTRQRPGQAIELSIRDTGEGMDPEVLRRAIEPFYTTKPQGKGTGLGLAMVYGTVKAHRGTLEITSRPGHGTKVRLGFPPMPHAEASGPVDAAGPAPDGASGSLRILLVDDDELIRQSVGPMLETLGHRVASVASGLEAVAHLERGRAVQDPDLVILDMNMPGLNGAQTLPRLLALRPGLPVLMATGYSDAAIAPLLNGRPNVASLRKPFSREEIRQKLAALMRGQA